MPSEIPMSFVVLLSDWIAREKPTAYIMAFVKQNAKNYFAFWNDVWKSHDVHYVFEELVKHSDDKCLNYLETFVDFCNLPTNDVHIFCLVLHRILKNDHIRCLKYILKISRINMNNVELSYPVIHLKKGKYGAKKIIEYILDENNNDQMKFLSDAVYFSIRHYQLPKILFMEALKNAWTDILLLDNPGTIDHFVARGLPVKTDIFAKILYHYNTRYNTMDKSFRHCLKKKWVLPEEFMSLFQFRDICPCFSFIVHILENYEMPDKIKNDVFINFCWHVAPFYAHDADDMTEMYKQILKICPDVNARDSVYHKTPLMYAAEMGNRLLCRRLLVDGADPLIRNDDTRESSFSNYRAVDLAKRYGRDQLFAELEAETAYAEQGHTNRFLFELCNGDEVYMRGNHVVIVKYEKFDVVTEKCYII